MLNNKKIILGSLIWSLTNYKDLRTHCDESYLLKSWNVQNNFENKTCARQMAYFGLKI